MLNHFNSRQVEVNLDKISKMLVKSSHLCAQLISRKRQFQTKLTKKCACVNYTILKKFLTKMLYQSKKNRSVGLNTSFTMRY